MNFSLSWRADRKLGAFACGVFQPFVIGYHDKLTFVRHFNSKVRKPKTFLASMMMKTKPPKTIDEYLSTVSDEHRVALERLRKQIHAAAPKAEERISYGVPAFFQNGGLVWFAAAKNHCSFFPGGRAVEMHKSELKNYSLSKGTIRFQPDKPLPAMLVRRIVKERIAANEMKAARKRK